MTTIPLIAPAWCKNPSGYVKHQKLLVQLIDYFESHGLTVSIPPDLKGWDRGRDITVNGAVLDLKAIRLAAANECGQMHWDSPYYENNPNPTTYTGSLTDYFVHAQGQDVESWVMGPAVALLADRYHLNPYYKVGTTLTVGEFAILNGTVGELSTSEFTDSLDVL